MAKSVTMAPVSRVGDAVFRWLCFAMVCVVLVLVLLVGWTLWRGSADVFSKFGFRFLTSSAWDPVKGDFGALPFIFGTLVSSVLALLIATPLAVATAIYLTELAPPWLRQPLTALVEMLAAVPSVIFGLWGVLVLVPWMREYLQPLLGATLGWTPFFRPRFGPSMLAASLIIAVMILPIITSVSREILRSVPDLQREAAYGLGATRWEVTRIAVLSYAKNGIFGAMILGLGRALGETMAVTMVIGNTRQITANLLAPAHTMASVISSEFSEATSDEYLHALYAIGLVLLGVTLIVNLLAQLLLKTFGGSSSSSAKA